MYVCQSLPNCMIHSKSVLYHNKTVLFSPRVHPSWLLYPSHSICSLSRTGVGVGQWLPFCEGTEVCSQKSWEKSAIVNMRGRTLLWNAEPGDTRDLPWGMRLVWSAFTLAFCFENLWSSWIGGKQPKALGSGRMTSQEFGVQSSETPQGMFVLHLSRVFLWRTLLSKAGVSWQTAGVSQKLHTTYHRIPTCTNTDNSSYQK